MALRIGLFEHTPVERKPRGVAVEVVLGTVECDTSHESGD